MEKDWDNKEKKITLVLTLLQRLNSVNEQQTMKVSQELRVLNAKHNGEESVCDRGWTSCDALLKLHR